LLKKHKGHEDKLLEDLTRHFTALDGLKVPPLPPRKPKVDAKKRITVGTGGFFGSAPNIGSHLSATFNLLNPHDDKKKDTKSTRFNLFGSKQTPAT
jgi:hypothetical protein